MWDVVCLAYDTTSGKSLLWVIHGNIRDFACRLPWRASTLNLFNREYFEYFDESSGLNGYIDVQLLQVYSNWSHCCSNDLPLPLTKGCLFTFHTF